MTPCPPFFCEKILGEIMELKNVVKKFNRWPDYFGPKKGACDVLVVYNGGRIMWYDSNGCHGIMGDVYGDISVIYSSLWVRHEDTFEAAKEYWDYLLSPEVSPFRAVLADVIRVNDAAGRPLAFGIADAKNKSKQLCMGLMMQCRVPQENSNKLYSFKLFRENGFDVAESFFLSEHYYYIKGKLYKFNSQYEHGFSATSGISFERLKNANPIYEVGRIWLNNVYSAPGSTYYAGYGYGKITTIWKQGATFKVWELLNMTPKYNGIFPKQFEKDHGSLDLPAGSAAPLDPKYAIEVLKANRTGW